jgi:hypothetical protein
MLQIWLVCHHLTNSLEIRLQLVLKAHDLHRWSLRLLLLEQLLNLGVHRVVLARLLLANHRLLLPIVWLNHRSDLLSLLLNLGITSLELTQDVVLLSLLLLLQL